MRQHSDPWSEVAQRFEALGFTLKVHAEAEQGQDAPALRSSVEALADVIERTAITIRDVCTDSMVRDDASDAVAAVGRALRASVAALPASPRPSEPFGHPPVEQELAHPGG